MRSAVSSIWSANRSASAFTAARSSAALTVIVPAFSITSVCRWAALGAQAQAANATSTAAVPIEPATGLKPWFMRASALTVTAAAAARVPRPCADDRLNGNSGRPELSPTLSI